MTTRDFTANVISASKVVPDGNFKTSKASGVWDINEALDLIKGGNWPNAANIDPAAFVDGVFSIDLYDGTGSSNTITNNINLTGKGGLVWIKRRNDTSDHNLFDNERGFATASTGLMSSNSTGASNDFADYFNATSTGFTLLHSGNDTNDSSSEYVSWTFRKQPKFFDIVTYTGNSTARTISHSLGSTPGMIILKSYGDSSDWIVYHRGNTAAPQTDALKLHSTVATSDNAGYFNDTAPTSTEFSLGDHTDANGNGKTFVAYLFAHNNDDGGFGEPGDQDIIKCGSYTGNTSGTEVNLGFEPQFVMIKKSSDSESWFVYDSMRGVATGGSDSQDKKLLWNSSQAESAVASPIIAFSANGFILESTDNEINGSGTYVYMAIRRGGMQTPSTPSTVFNIGTVQTDTNRTLTNSLTGNLSPDFVLFKTTAESDWTAQTRLTGKNALQPHDTDAELTIYGQNWGKVMHNVSADGTAATGTSSFGWMWARARGYFDVVTYTGTGSARTQSHNLGAVPEMIWVRPRNLAENWAIYHKDVGATKYLQLNTTAVPATSSTRWNDTTPTSSVFSLGADNEVNASSGGPFTYVAYLFATVAGVSKVGTCSHTFGGGDTNVDCGFSNGTKFLLIKSTTHTYNWEVYDSERGIVSGNDPYLKLNTNDAPVTNNDGIDPLSSGFTLTSTGWNTGTYIFYAIAVDPS